MKTCNKCKKAKCDSLFYKDSGKTDGKKSICKVCCSITSKAHRENNPEAYRGNKVKYYSTETGKLNKKKSLNKWRRNNPEKRKAHDAVAYSLKTKKLEKEPCSKCGSKTVHAHHEDYSKPLEVVWLCHKHHMEIHNKTLV